MLHYKYLFQEKLCIKYKLLEKFWWNNFDYKIYDLDMPPRGRNVIRIEYDRTGQNAEILPYWPRLEDRPYYDLERRYSEGQGMVKNSCAS